jgi:hypothetical protein
MTDFPGSHDQVGQALLGHEAYRTALGTEGMSLVAVHRDEGDNHYYFAQETA